MGMSSKTMAIAVAAILLVVVAGAGIFFLNKGDSGGTRNADTDFENMTWGDVLSEARGQTVNFYFWDGSSTINDFVDNDVAGEAAKYGITLNRVGVPTGPTIVQKVGSEIDAGITSGGSVDLAWLNGANFSELKAKGQLFGPWSQMIPNSVLVDWSIEAISNDMGDPVEGLESPWGTAQMQFIYNGDFSSADTSGNGYVDFIELLDWCKAGGNFTYPDPNGNDNFFGFGFIKSVMYELQSDGVGGYKLYEGDKQDGIERFAVGNTNFTNQSEFEAFTQYAWKYLEDLHPHLYSASGKYVDRSVISNLMMSDYEFLYMTYSSSGITMDINAGILPNDAKTQKMNTGLSDTSYVLIPSNASSKAAAMVVANILLQPDMQAMWMMKAGDGLAIDLGKLTEPMKELFDSYDERLPGSYLGQEDLKFANAPDICGYINPWIANIWKVKIQTLA